MAEALHWQHRVPADHPAFAGHFPGQPVLPGVILLDTLLANAARAGLAPAGWNIASCKFHAFVRPGETLTLELQPARNGWRFSVRAAEREVASGSLSPLEQAP